MVRAEDRIAITPNVTDCEHSLKGLRLFGANNP